MKNHWHVGTDRYRGKIYPCIRFYDENGLQSMMTLTRINEGQDGWQDFIQTCLIDQLDIEEGR